MQKIKFIKDIKDESFFCDYFDIMCDTSIKKYTLFYRKITLLCLRLKLLRLCSKDFVYLLTNVLMFISR